MDAADKVLGEEEEEEEEEEEKEHFFTDLAPVDEDMDGGGGASAAGAPSSSGLPPPSGGAAPSAAGSSSGASGAPAGAAGAGGAVGEQERRAQVGASPYLAPFTPLSSPSRPKTPSSVSVAQRGGRGGKPQLVPMKSSGTHAFSASKVAKDDVVAHLPTELVEALMTTVQTLDKLILGVEDYKADQLGFLYDKVTQYVELLKKVDATGAGYDAMIPLQVLE